MLAKGVSKSGLPFRVPAEGVLRRGWKIVSKLFYDRRDPRPKSYPLLMGYSQGIFQYYSHDFGYGGFLEFCFYLFLIFICW